MKTLIAAFSVFAFMAITNPISAQRGERFRGERNFPERREAFMQQRGTQLKFTEEQREKFHALNFETEKKLKPFQDQMRELRAKHQNLVTAGKPDMQAIVASLEQISKVQLEMAKIRAVQHQEFRAQLTEEQRLMFDKHRGMINKREGFRVPVR